MKRSLISLFIIFFVSIPLFKSSVSADELVIKGDIEIDELGYEYVAMKSSEIDFSLGDIYIAPLKDDNGENMYAVYDVSEVEKFERDFGLVNEVGGYERSFVTFASLPTKFSDYYSSSKWITRSGKVSLSLYPKKNAWINPTGVAQAHLHKYRWQVVYNKHSGDSKWKNTASMKAQLVCHAEYAKGNKTPWNIEPWRTTTNYATVVLNKCNAP